MIFIGLGANLPSAEFGPPVAACEAAIEALSAAGVTVRRRSRWYSSAPQPPSGQPDFVNGVVEVETALNPAELLDLLHRIEARLGRVRSARNAPRTIDLDLLDHDGRVSDGAEGPILPHPRLHERAFVLLPLRELAPDWRHPRTGEPIGALIGALPGDQRCRPAEVP